MSISEFIQSPQTLDVDVWDRLVGDQTPEQFALESERNGFRGASLGGEALHAAIVDYAAGLPDMFGDVTAQDAQAAISPLFRYARDYLAS